MYHAITSFIALLLLEGVLTIYYLLLSFVLYIFFPYVLFCLCTCFYNDYIVSYSVYIIFPVMHERGRYFNWFIVAAFLASAALNDSKWALRSKLPITMLGRSRGKTGERLRPLTLENKGK